MTRLAGHEGSVKAHKEAFLNDPINQTKVFSLSFKFRTSDGLGIAYYDRLRRYLCQIINGDVSRDH